MLVCKKGSILEVDIHGMRPEDAKRQLEFLITRAEKGTREMVVIHGYSHGRVQMCIRDRFYSISATAAASPSVFSI